jgi:effector-binding domain-containing protein
VVIPWRVRRKANRHEVLQLSNPVRKQEARYQDIRRGPIKLFVPHMIADWGDLKSASIYVVQERSKDTGRIKVRVTIPVDRTIHAHKGDRTHVADDSVVFDGLIWHRCSLQAPV